jgi:hypothetical protein
MAIWRGCSEACIRNFVPNLLLPRIIAALRFGLSLPDGQQGVPLSRLEEFPPPCFAGFSYSQPPLLFPILRRAEENLYTWHATFSAFLNGISSEGIVGLLAHVND